MHKRLDVGGAGKSELKKSDMIKNFSSALISLPCNFDKHIISLMKNTDNNTVNSQPKNLY